MSAPWFAQLRPAPPSAVRCADPTRPLCVRVLDSTGKFLYALCIGFTASNLIAWQAAKETLCLSLSNRDHIGEQPSDSRPRSVLASDQDSLASNSETTSESVSVCTFDSWTHGTYTLSSTTTDTTRNVMRPLPRFSLEFKFSCAFSKSLQRTVV